MSLVDIIKAGVSAACERQRLYGCWASESEWDSHHLVADIRSRAAQSLEYSHTVEESPNLVSR